MALPRTGMSSLIAIAAVASASLLAGPAASSPRKPKPQPPRIVAAAMLDVNRDARADAVRITYSVPIRHAVDADGAYPLTVTGYRIRSVGAASGRALTIQLVEHAQPDPAARPAIRYRRTRSKPVVAADGLQAASQVFTSVSPHGHEPPTSTPSPPTTTTTNTTTTTTTPLDSDRDGTPDTQDCAPHDPTIHPGAPDLPDLGFVDSNCDGIDGTLSDAIFVSPNGNDASPGTESKPMRQIQPAITAAAAAGSGHYVLVAIGVYQPFQAGTGVGIYGGYDPSTWSRSNACCTKVIGAPQAVVASGVTGVVLQLLTLVGDALTGTSPQDRSVYGIRAVGSELTLQGDMIDANSGLAGAAGTDGAAGAPGGSGTVGGAACDSTAHAVGGKGGLGADGLHGGTGGSGGGPDESGAAGQSPVEAAGGGGG